MAPVALKTIRFYLAAQRMARMMDMPGFADGSWVDGFPEGERLQWATTTLHDEGASQAEREKAALILGYRNTEEALLPENAGKPRPIAAAILRDVFPEGVVRAKPTTPPPFPDATETKPRS